jgi:hypothetical protein
LNSFCNSGFTAARISRTSSRLFTSIPSFSYLLINYLHVAPLLRNRAGRPGERITIWQKETSGLTKVGAHIPVPASIAHCNTRHRLGRAKYSLPEANGWGRAAQPLSVDDFLKTNVSTCFLSVLVVMSTCQSSLSPLVVALTEYRERERILCATQQGNMELGAPPVAAIVRALALPVRAGFP